MESIVERLLSWGFEGLVKVFKGKLNEYLLYNSTDELFLNPSEAVTISTILLTMQ